LAEAFIAAVTVITMTAKNTLVNPIFLLRLNMIILI